MRINDAWVVAGRNPLVGTVAGDTPATLVIIRRGIPRLIDQLAEHSLLLALRDKKKEIDTDIVTEAIDEVEP